MKNKAHPGLETAAESIGQKMKIPLGRARAILAESSRNASPAAKRANPRLNRVKG